MVIELHIAQFIQYDALIAKMNNTHVIVYHNGHIEAQKVHQMNVLTLL